MRIRLIIVIILGIMMSLLGALWFLQGTQIVYVPPILCFADCVPITEKSVLWQWAGIITFLIGVVTIVVCINRSRRQSRVK